MLRFAQVGDFGGYMRLGFVLLSCAIFLAGCASTSSTIIPRMSGPPLAAVLPLTGDLGEQASDLLSQEFARNGVAVVETGRLRSVVAVDTDLSSATPAAVATLKSYGEQLGVSFLFSGTVSTDRGPLSSYPHVFITLRLLEVSNGQTRWVGRYGNSMWTSAWSTQGDLERGANDIVQEFIKAGGPAILRE